MENNSLFKTPKYHNLWMNIKEAINMQFVCILLHIRCMNICRKFEFLISQGSAATYPR